MLKAARIKTWQGRAEILEVHDGDTFKAWVDLGWNIYFRATIRVRGVNSPELPTFAGVQAQLFLRDLLKPGAVVTLNSKRLDLHGRAEADVFLPNATCPDIFDRSLAQILIDARQAVPADDRGNL
jgi:endonuclease YncB( thermonuclease family)